MMRTVVIYAVLSIFLAIWTAHYVRSLPPSTGPVMEFDPVTNARPNSPKRN